MIVENQDNYTVNILRKMNERKKLIILLGVIISLIITISILFIQNYNAKVITIGIFGFIEYLVILYWSEFSKNNKAKIVFKKLNIPIQPTIKDLIPKNSLHQNKCTSCSKTLKFYSKVRCRACNKLFCKKCTNYGLCIDDFDQMSEEIKNEFIDYSHKEKRHNIAVFSTVIFNIIAFILNITLIWKINILVLTISIGILIIITDIIMFFYIFKKNPIDYSNKDKILRRAFPDKVISSFFNQMPDQEKLIQIDKNAMFDRIAQSKQNFKDFKMRKIIILSLNALIPPIILSIIFSSYFDKNQSVLTILLVISAYLVITSFLIFTISYQFKTWIKKNETKCSFCNQPALQNLKINPNLTLFCRVPVCKDHDFLIRKNYLFANKSQNFFSYYSKMLSISVFMYIFILVGTLFVLLIFRSRENLDEITNLFINGMILGSAIYSCTHSIKFLKKLNSSFFF